MNVFNIRTIRDTFTVFCVVCVLCMVIFWVCKYRVDRDIGVVDYVLLEEAWDIKLPAVSMCFHNPFIDEKLIEYDPEATRSSYIEYLKGNVDNEKYHNIDYFDVTLSLEKYFLSSTVVLRDLTPLYDVPFQHRESFNGFIMGLFIKCFEITINITDYHNVLFIALTYDKKKLLLDFKTESDYNLSIIMHHPGQFLLNSIKDFEHFDMKADMGITISDLELLKSRNSRNRQCTEYDDETYFDDMVRERHLLNIGCRAPYLKSNEYYPPCNSTTAIKNVLYDYKVVGKKYYPKSCLRYSKIIYQQYEKILIEYLTYTKERAKANDTVGENEGMGNGMKHNDEEDLKMEQLKEGSRDEKQTVQKWHFGIEYPQYVRIISQSKDVDIHALIGNIGGYVGLFLGCALIQIPDMILSIYSYLKAWIRKRNALHHDIPSSHTPFFDKSTKDGNVSTRPTASRNGINDQVDDDASQIANLSIDQAISVKHREDDKRIKDLQMLYSELKSRINKVEKKMNNV